MSLIKRPRPTTYIGGDELHGIINLLIDRIDELDDKGSTLTKYYIGAVYALEVIAEQDYVQYPGDYLGLLELKITGNGALIDSFDSDEGRCPF